MLNNFIHWLKAVLRNILETYGCTKTCLQILSWVKTVQMSCTHTQHSKENVFQKLKWILQNSFIQKFGQGSVLWNYVLRNSVCWKTSACKKWRGADWKACWCMLAVTCWGSGMTWKLCWEKCCKKYGCTATTRPQMLHWTKGVQMSCTHSQWCKGWAGMTIPWGHAPTQTYHSK